jgi:hypothetical protein
MSDMDSELALVRNALGKALGEDIPVMVTSFVAVGKIIEPDGRVAIVSISDCELAAESLGMFAFGVEEAKRQIFGGRHEG